MRRHRNRIRGTRVLAGVLASTFVYTSAAVVGGPACGDPIIDNQSLLAQVTSPDGSKIDSAQLNNGRNIRLSVWSAAMGKDITIDVQRPADTSVPRPVLYLLNGAGGGEDSASWVNQTDIVSGFLGDKNVNVVQPIGGRWSYYTDWIKDDPVLGRNKWKTFFTEELPPVIDAALGTNGVNAIAGLSTSGTTVLALPIAKPGLYKAAAAYSGCAQTSDPIGSRFVKMTVDVWGGGDTDNMWGPDGSQGWVDNDPYVHADQLRGLDLYISTGTGIPGQYDQLNGPYTLPGPGGLANQIIIGGVIEAGVDYCTHNLVNKLNDLGIPVTANFRPTGTHSWGYWHDDFISSWPVLAQGLGI
ncbi:alpha/beta hydrolase [Nocardia stercoris]|uniref:Esterase family protein n=1 Tax=Nocardia stercoris TaxID=2483361 RepID=A0A3M2KZQ8_9NOCA|nr:alpha/beta hydrolase family protein [Nocardia stercoris]RMI30967.1 esterase family protein [Nocardia stercoris]